MFWLKLQNGWQKGTISKAEKPKVLFPKEKEMDSWPRAPNIPDGEGQTF